MLIYHTTCNEQHYNVSTSIEYTKQNLTAWYNNLEILKFVRNQLNCSQVYVYGLYNPFRYKLVKSLISVPCDQSANIKQDILNGQTILVVRPSVIVALPAQSLNIVKR